MKVMGIDPGTHTGVAWWDDAHLDLIKEGGTSGFVDHCGECVLCGYKEFEGRGRKGERRMASEVGGLVAHLVDTENSPDCIFCEDFILRGGQLHSSERAGLSADRLQFGIEIWVMDVVEWEGNWVMQTAGQAKSVVTDARLRSRGMWVPGSAHVRDALRHSVLGYRRVRAGSV